MPPCLPPLVPAPPPPPPLPDAHNQQGTVPPCLLLLLGLGAERMLPGAPGLRGTRLHASAAAA